MRLEAGPPTVRVAAGVKWRAEEVDEDRDVRKVERGGVRESRPDHGGKSMVTNVERDTLSGGPSMATHAKRETLCRHRKIVSSLLFNS
jgi:hypothetical protein